MKKSITITLMLIVLILSLLIIASEGSTSLANAVLFIFAVSTPYLHLYFLIRITKNSKTLIFLGLLTLLLGCISIWLLILTLFIAFDAMGGLLVMIVLIAQLIATALATIPALLTRK